MTDRGHLPIYTHTEVLGVDIGYWQRGERGIDIRRYGVDSNTHPRVKRELCYWARRNLF